jgi:hypothetical protein
MGLSSESRPDEVASSSLADDMLAVCRAAARVEHDPDEAAGWYLHTRIAELGDLTAAQLVALGRADDVMRFLEAVCSGARD